MSALPLTLGVEEEFHVVDLGSRRVAPRAEEILEPLDTGGTRSPFTGEVQLSMLETRTDVWNDLRDLERQLRDLRIDLRTAAEKLGCGVASAGTLPLYTRGELQLSTESRYRRVIQLHDEVIRDQVVCGCHVHVGVGSRETAVRLLPYILPWAPVLLALSASSPYRTEHDTGYASFRTMSWSRWPTAGTPALFSSLHEYEAVVQRLVDTDTIADAGQIYWDVRPSRRFPTLEFRVADATTTLDETLLQAALSRGLVRAAHRAASAGAPPPRFRGEVLRAARWHAARWGIEDQLVDALSGERRPARDVVNALVDHVDEDLRALGDRGAVQRFVETAFAHGSSAARQRRAHRRSGTLEAVVDHVVSETHPG